MLECDGRTDRRTDRRTDTSTMAKTREALHAVERNQNHVYMDCRTGVRRWVP